MKARGQKKKFFVLFLREKGKGGKSAGESMTNGQERALVVQADS